MLPSDYLIIVPWAVALFSLFLSSKMWIPLLSLVCFVGYWQDRFTLWSLLFLASGFSITLLIASIKKHEKNIVTEKKLLSVTKTDVIAFLHLLLVLWILWLFVNGIPGAEYVLLLDKVYAGADAVPFTLYVGLDKTAVVFALAVAVPDLFQKRSVKQQRWQNWLLLALGLLAIQILACILGLVRPDVKVPSWWWMFALHNLLITCTVEESFFRGYIQQGVEGVLGWRGGLLIGSMLFGIAHYSGGLIYMCLAGLAGIGYGAALGMTGRLWASILIHFLFNLSHLLLYTYPVLK